MSGVANHYKFVLTARWIPEKSDAGQQFMSLRYWATRDLGVGFDYRPLIDQLKFNATYRLVSEDQKDGSQRFYLGQVLMTLPPREFKHSHAPTSLP